MTDDWKVKKKALKEGEGYEKPNEMAKVKGMDRGTLTSAKVAGWMLLLSRLNHSSAILLFYI